LPFGFTDAMPLIPSDGCPIISHALKFIHSHVLGVKLKERTKIVAGPSEFLTSIITVAT